MALGENLKLLRDLQDKTQKDVADAIGVKVNTYSQYENNVRKPNFDILRKLIEYFHVNYDFLLNVNEDVEVNEDMGIFNAFLDLYSESIRKAKKIIYKLEELSEGTPEYDHYIGILINLKSEYENSKEGLSNYIDIDKIDNEFDKYIKL